MNIRRMAMVMDKRLNRIVRTMLYSREPFSESYLIQLLQADQITDFSISFFEASANVLKFKIGNRLVPNDDFYWSNVEAERAQDFTTISIASC